MTPPEVRPWFQRTRIAADSPRSLCWRGQELVDWVAGGDTWSADGRLTRARVSWGYGRFDAVATNATGEWAVVHERTGTCGILLQKGEMLRELHRSCYHADVYEYPVCLFERQGRMLLAHCPESYARIEIEDAETGKRLTSDLARKEVDFFHARLELSPGGKRLLSAGWIWQPVDSVVWFDVRAALELPATLDALVFAEPSSEEDFVERSTATWLDDDRIALGSSGEQGPEVTVVDVSRAKIVSSVELPHPPGRMMRAGAHHLVTFFEHPRLISLRTSAVVHEWPDIDSGHTVSSIVRQQPQRALALDPMAGRFAVAGHDGIDVVALDLSSLPES